MKRAQSYFWLFLMISDGIDTQSRKLNRTIQLRWKNYVEEEEGNIKVLNKSIANSNIKIKHPSQLNEMDTIIQEKLDDIITLSAKLYYMIVTHIKRGNKPNLGLIIIENSLKQYRQWIHNTYDFLKQLGINVQVKISVNFFPSNNTDVSNMRNVLKLMKGKMKFFIDLVDSFQPKIIVKCLQAGCRAYCLELEGNIQDVADFDEMHSDQIYTSHSKVLYTDDPITKTMIKADESLTKNLFYTKFGFLQIFICILFITWVFVSFLLKK